MVTALVLGGCEFDYKPGAKMPQKHPTKNDLRVGGNCIGKGLHTRYWVGTVLPRPAHEAGITATDSCSSTRVRIGWMSVNGQQWSSTYYDSTDGDIDGTASIIVSTGTNKAKNSACTSVCDTEET
ncbi:MAG TPA: hypothetical protein VK507_22860 [Iamia sp.]|nr:hypothetical protein [Iamia sp.]